jgi:hypothetical protein
MPMGIVDDAEFQKEIQRSSQVVTIQRGRGNTRNVPESLRKIIGENAVEEGSKATKVMTNAFGISDSSLSAYKHGANSTASYNDPAFKPAIDKVRDKITRKARSRLIASLNAITPEKLSDEKPRDLAGIAKDMSAIIKNMEPDAEKDKIPQALIIFAPRMVTEEKFEVIDVGE